MKKKKVLLLYGHVSVTREEKHRKKGNFNLYFSKLCKTVSVNMHFFFCIITQTHSNIFVQKPN